MRLVISLRDEEAGRSDDQQGDCRSHEGLECL